MLLKDHSKLDKTSCVYKLEHPKCSSYYIGRTNNLKRRASEHYRKLVANTHANPRMQNVHNKYGDGWEISILFIGNVEECTNKEQELLDLTDLKDSLNCHLSSVGGSVGTFPSKEKVFALLDWAVTNSKTRSEALCQFKCSGDALKKYQPEWESLNGKLDLPLRASGEKSGAFKHGMSRELRRKRTAEELTALNEVRRERMTGNNNPMFGKTHTTEAREVQSASAKEQARRRREANVQVSDSTRLKISTALKEKPKSDGARRAMAMSQLGKLYSTPFGVFHTSKECEDASGVKAATVMWRCKNNYLGEWGYITP